MRTSGQIRVGHRINRTEKSASKKTTRARLTNTVCILTEDGGNENPAYNNKKPHFCT